MTSPRKKRVWNVADFAAHAGLSHRSARRLLKRLDERHRGRLLMPSGGTNREYSFFPAVLARLEPDLFAPIESIEYRLDELEDDVAEMRVREKRIVAQVGQNTRDIARIHVPNRVVRKRESTRIDA